MRFLLLVVLVLGFVSQAQAAPEDFRESTRLTPRMQAISGNPQAVVYCATSWTAWESAVQDAFSAETRAATIRAFTTRGRAVSYLQQYECSALEKWLRGKTVSRYDVGVAAHTLSHEALHVAGVLDEREAECISLARLAETLRVHFGVKNPVAVREMVTGARQKNRRAANVC